MQDYLPLSGERTVTGGDTEDKGIEVDEIVGGEGGVVRLGWGMEFGQDFIGKSLFDPVKRQFRGELGPREKRTHW